PMAMPSSTAMVLNSLPMPPTFSTSSRTSWPMSLRWTCPGTNCVNELAMAMIGLPKSPSCMPVARHKARAPAMLRPWVDVRERSGRLIWAILLLRPRGSGRARSQGTTGVPMPAASVRTVTHGPTGCGRQHRTGPSSRDARDLGPKNGPSGPEMLVVSEREALNLEGIMATAARSDRFIKGVGIASFVVGLVLLLAGIGTWTMVSSQLADEEITVAEDARWFAGEQVRGPLTAYSQADIINTHALE